MSKIVKVTFVTVFILLIATGYFVYMAQTTSSENTAQETSLTQQLPKNLPSFNTQTNENEEALKDKIEAHISTVDLIFDGILLETKEIKSSDALVEAKYKIEKVYKGSYTKGTINITHETPNTISQEKNGVRLVQAYKWQDSKFYDFPEKKPFYRTLWPEGDQTLRKYFNQ